MISVIGGEDLLCQVKSPLAEGLLHGPAHDGLVLFQYKVTSFRPAFLS